MNAVPLHQRPLDVRQERLEQLGWHFTYNHTFGAWMADPPEVVDDHGRPYRGDSYIGRDLVDAIRHAEREHEKRFPL